MKIKSTIIHSDCGYCTASHVETKALNGVVTTTPFNAFVIWLFLHSSSIQQFFISFHHLNFQTMKGTFATHGLKMVVAMFFLFGGLLLTNRAEAQVSSTNAQFNSPSANWLTEQEALAVLQVEVQNLAQNLQVLVPGSQGYINTEMHIRYYKEIYRQIDGGSVVPDAVRNALGAVTNSNGSTVPSKTLLGLLYDEAVDLLSV
jgi:hypothetical protein